MKALMMIGLLVLSMNSFASEYNMKCVKVTTLPPNDYFRYRVQLFRCENKEVVCYITNKDVEFRCDWKKNANK